MEFPFRSYCVTGCTDSSYSTHALRIFTNIRAYHFSLLFIGLFAVFSNPVEAATPAVMAGGFHSCALSSGGVVQCWGSNNEGQLGNGTTTDSATPVPVSGLSIGVIAIAVGFKHNCALTSEGAVQCWGSRTGSTLPRNIPEPVPGLSSGVVAISAGYGHTCAITSAGAMQCWGENFYGQLGDGTTTQTTTPVPVSGLGSGVVAIAAGDFYTCAVTSTGVAQCWGYNTNGQLGNGTTTQSLTPVPVVGLPAGVATISTGDNHACALTSAGTGFCWGANNYGQLGDGTTTPSSTAVPVNGLPSDVVAIEAGKNHTCALTSLGAMQCWGYNYHGQLGDGTTSGYFSGVPTPVAVSGLSSGVTAITAGYAHSCATTDVGTVQCWGLNSIGQLGNGRTDHFSTPVPVNGLGNNIIATALGQQHTCALTNAGAVLCWGYNNAGQLGNGTATPSATPVPVSSLSSGVIAIAAGGSHSCALTGAGAVWCWGNGLLGNGTTTGSTVPVPVSGLSSGVFALAAGYAHNCAITNGGAMQCWGDNNYGQLGNGTTTDSTVPVPVNGLSSGVNSITAGDGYTCSVTSAGAAQCWGNNNYGKLGDGTTTQSSTPVAVSGLSAGVVAIAASYSGYLANHTCARTSTAAVQCWGNNGLGQLGNGSTTGSTVPVPVSGLGTGAVAIATGSYHTCVLTFAGEAQCWGSNIYGQIGNGAPENLLGTSVLSPAPVIGLGSGVIKLAAGGWHSCAVTSAGVLQCWGYNFYGQLGNGAFGYETIPGSVVNFSGQGTLNLLDLDNDSVDDSVDNCPNIANTGQEDVGDGDGIGDACDNCTLVANADQRDTNGDGYGNMCDADLDNTDGLNVVNLTDYGQFTSVWRATAPGVEPYTLSDHADFNGDGVVNLTDYGIFSASWRGAPGPSGLNP